MSIKNILPGAIFISLLFSLQNFAVGQNPTIRWVATNTSEVLSLGLNPVGFQGSTGTVLYLCRGETATAGRFLPGKLWIGSQTNHVVQCFYNDIGQAQIGSTNFAVLEAPKGTLSWVSINSQTAPNTTTWIRGGTHLDGNAAYICRSTYNLLPGSLIVGKYHDPEKICFITADGVEWRGNVVEILMINPYGKSLGLNPP